VYIGDLLELECIWPSEVLKDSRDNDDISWAKVNDDMENNVENLGSVIKYVVFLSSASLG